MTPKLKENGRPMKNNSKVNLLVAAIIAVLALAVLPAKAQNYTVSFTSGGSWNTVYGQGFSTSLGATPAQSLANGSEVDLTQFQFFKSGNSDSAANFQLAIFNTLYPNLSGLTTSSPSLIGLSANTIASTAALNTGDAITFTFNNLPLSYGSDYGAIFVNVNGTSITPVLVSALTANYALQPDNNYHPTANYGTESQYQYATTDFINGSYFSAFNYAGDANFSASLTAVPEPATGAMLGLGTLLLLAVRRCRRP
jgi:hypothetical protein